MIKKINLGCGPIGKDDWINVDWGILAFLHKFRFIECLLMKLKLLPKGYDVAWPKNLKLHNCKRRLPFKNDSIDYIYTSHFLEHFKRFEAEKIIRDCFRILKKGGIIRISIPDLELLVKKYLDKDLDYFIKIEKLMNFGEKNSKQIKKENLAEALLDNFYPHFYKKEPNGLEKITNRFVRPHNWMYDFDSLRHLLEKAGFRNIERKKFKDGRVPDLEYLDVFGDMSLYVEAEK